MCIRDRPYIELRFDQPPRTSSGFIFGTDPDTSDIVLPSVKEVSRHHLALTYKDTFNDKIPRLIIRDLGSSKGTTVYYDGQGYERRGFDWIIHGFDFLDNIKTLAMKLGEGLLFRVVVACHDIKSNAYIANVKGFQRGAADPESLLGGLGLRSGLATGLQTGVFMPAEGSLIIRSKIINMGAFGVVFHC